MSERDERQVRVLRWARETFGDVALHRHERARRFLEEAVELAQACGMEFADADNIVSYVYAMERGEIGQEVGGVSLTLLGLCEVCGVSAEAEERREFARVLLTDPARLRAKHAAKIAAGVSS